MSAHPGFAARIGRFRALLLVAVLLGAGCARGTAGHACFANLTCYPDLSCKAGRCAAATDPVRKTSSPAGGLPSEDARLGDTGARLGCCATDPVVGWWQDGDMIPGLYSTGVDRDIRHSGGASGFITSARGSAGTFGGLEQALTPDAYIGKRLKLMGWLRTKEVTGWSGLWMRIDTPHGIGAFDNMEARSLKGTKDWTNCEIVLDVATDAVNISFGALMDGAGTTWVDDVSFEVVSAVVPSTAMDLGAGGSARGRTLRNLDFEE